MTDIPKYKVVLREGIVENGFAGPTVGQALEIEGDDNGAKISRSSLKPESTKDYHTLSGAFSEDLTSIFEMLKEKLQTLPPDPVGFQDIYGLKTSVFFGLDDFQWYNAIAGSCSEDKPDVQLTEEQKETFKEVVDIIKGLGEKQALT
ncbi:hypothetical protein BD408DRAFT_421450 [Parasitella parasitica]|nr:hypothetical protein BD408DRAFT_421450 [Parasitella parasitica]